MKEEHVKNSPEINERFVNDFAVTVPDARRVTEILQLTLRADPHLGGGFPEVVTATTGQLIKRRRRTKTETRHSECLNERKIKLQQTTRKITKQTAQLCYLSKLIAEYSK